MIAYSIATCGGIGLVPYAPGTVSSAFAAITGWFFVLHLFAISIHIGLLGLFFAIGWWSTYMVLYPSEHDPSWVVIDEWCAMWMLLCCIPQTFTCYVAAFVLFRFFDIAKPGIIRVVERLPGVWGVMLDDVVAAAHAAIVLHGLCYAWQIWL